MIYLNILLYNILIAWLYDLYKYTFIQHIDSLVLEISGIIIFEGI